MDANATQSPATSDRQFGWKFWVFVSVVVMGCAVSAIALTGRSPSHAPKDRLQFPPPLVLRDGVQPGSLLSRASQALVEKHFTTAQQGFDQVLAHDAHNASAKVGSIYAQWPQLGASGTITAIKDELKILPKDPYLRLSLGIVEAYSGQSSVGSKDLTAARSMSLHVVGDFDIARRADDLLHPALAPGYPPLLARPEQAKTLIGHNLIERIQSAISRGDRLRAMAESANRHARQIAQKDPAVASAVAMASFDKNEPTRAVRELAEARLAFPHDSSLLLHTALISLWLGHREGGLKDLRSVVADGSARPADRSAARELLAAINAG